MKISGSFVDLKQEKDSALFSLLVIDEGDNKDRDCATFIYNCHHWLYLKGVAIMKNPVVKSQAKCFCHCHEGFFLPCRTRRPFATRGIAPYRTLERLQV